MNKDIINWLLTYPDTKNVYFNEGGEWSFHPREGFTKVVTREQVLATTAETTEETKTKTSKTKN